MSHFPTPNDNLLMLKLLQRSIDQWDKGSQRSDSFATDEALLLGAKVVAVTPTSGFAQFDEFESTWTRYSPCPLELSACTSYLVPPPSKVHACCCCCCYDKVWYLVTELAQVPTFRSCWQVSFLRWFLLLSVPVSTISHPRPCSLLPGENFPASIFFPNPPSSTRPRPFFPLLILDESSSVVTTQCRWHSAINVLKVLLWSKHCYAEAPATEKKLFPLPAQPPYWKGRQCPLSW